MPELLQQSEANAEGVLDGVPPTLAGASGRGTDVRVATERSVRDELRRQIGALERRLGELFASSFPRQGIEWRVGAAGGPRVLGVAELERVRDALAARLHQAQQELGRRGKIEEHNRGTLEALIAEPDRHPWVRISNEDIGEKGCKHWHSRPRWGPLGILLNWWRVKVSSGCPLATGCGVWPHPASEQQEPEAQARSLARGRRAARQAG